MGTVFKARQLQAKAGTRFAALFLQSKGYSINSALWILCKTVERRP